MSVWYFKPRLGFSLNEGGGPANLTVLWGDEKLGFFVYVYVAGRRFGWSTKCGRVV